MSERRACRVIDADRKGVRYRSIRDGDGALREKLDTRNNRDFGRAMIRSVFDEVSVGI